MSKKLKVENRKLNAGYTVKIWRDGSGDIVLIKGKETWSDVIRAMHHLTRETEDATQKAREEVIEEMGKALDDFLLTETDPKPEGNWEKGYQAGIWRAKKILQNFKSKSQPKGE